MELQKGLNCKEKGKKLLDLTPEIAIIQESFQPKEFNEDIGVQPTKHGYHTLIRLS